MIGCRGRGSAIGAVGARGGIPCWIMTNRSKSATRENVVGLGTGAGAGRTGFPPRDQLPAGVSIEKLPVLGTSWYERGADYWVRRVWLFLLMALVVTLTSLLVGGARAQGPAPAGAATRPAPVRRGLVPPGQKVIGHQGAGSHDIAADSAAREPGVASVIRPALAMAVRRVPPR